MPNHHTQESDLPVIRILGGGPSGLSAAFHLTSPKANPGWQEKYRVVVHQMGWRLGGKGATGRNADAAHRLEEHGIHLFGNMYINSLHMMKDALAEVAAHQGTTPPPMEEEFRPSNYELVSDFYDGRWHVFGGDLPSNDEHPWDVDSASADPLTIIRSVLSAMSGHLGSTELPVPGSTSGSKKSNEKKDARFASARAFVAHFGSHSLSSDLHEVIADAEAGVEHLDLHGLIVLLERAVGVVEKAMAEITHGENVLRNVYVKVDLMLATLRGAIADDIFGSAGIDSVDDVDYRPWLAKHGASALTMESSASLVIPNISQAYPNGDGTDLPKMSASAFLTFVLRALVGPGDAMYFFKVGTGETVILPLYEALVNRGVEFEFFQRVRDLVPSEDGMRIASLVVEQQATPKGHYDPLVTLSDGQRVWPSKAKFDDLEEGAALEAGEIDLESWWADWEGPCHEVELGPSDQVVVCLPPRVQALVCGSAAAAKPAWASMLDNVQTSATMALQVWFDRSTTELGWPELEKTDRAFGATYDNPLNGFGDFSEAIQFEQWPEGEEPKGLIYFCGPLQDPVTVPDFSDHDYPARMKAHVESTAAQYFRTIGGLLPFGDADGVRPNSIDFSLLHAYDEATAGVGANRMAQQYARANIDPNERYTLSVAGTLKYRLKAWESGYENCALSSDAIYTGFNIGSFEGSVMSGMLASLALVGSPTLDQIHGYDFLHPGATGPGRVMLPAENEPEV